MKNLIPFYPIFNLYKKNKDYKDCISIIWDYLSVYLIILLILIITFFIIMDIGKSFFFISMYPISIFVFIAMRGYFKKNYERNNYIKEYLIDIKDFPKDNLINSLNFKYENKLYKIDLKELYNNKTKDTGYFAIDEFYETRENIKIIIIKDYLKNKNRNYYKKNIIEIYYPMNFNL